MKPAFKRQCQAMTRGTTQSEPRRCLKTGGVRKIGHYYICAHHRAAELKIRAR